MNDCLHIREAIQERMDGPIAAELQVAIEAHLLRCSGCREAQQGLVAVRRSLEALESPPLPQEALDGVWSRTVLASKQAAPVRMRLFGLDWRVVAAAAAVLVTLLLLPALRRPAPTPNDYAPADLSRAAQDARRVLALTAQALRKTESAARDRVLAGEVSPALRRIPIGWPQKPAPDSRRSRT